jgi:2-haloacid dehalogenase
MSVIKGVIFDLGGVLVDWDPMHLYRKVFADEARAADFIANICTPDWNEKQDAGRALDEATAERVALFPEWETEIRAYYGRWIEMIGGLVPGTADIMRELKAAGLRLFALSNWNSETFARVRDMFPEFDLFEDIVLSGDHRCVKPEERFYRIALERIDLPLQSLVFVDDNLRNLEGAEQVGLRALLFAGAGNLRRDLRALGVPIAAGA